MRRLLAAVGALAVTSALGLSGCGVLPGIGSDTITVTALLPDSAGLFEGNDVGVLGVPVGEITSIEPDGSAVRVELEIDADRKVPVDVVAAVIARSVATDRYVELTPVWTEGPVLEDGDVIEPENTRTPVDFDEVLAALEGLATGISGDGATTEAVRRVVEAADAAFSGNGQLLNDTIGSLSDAGNGVSAQREQVTATIEALDDLVATVDANRTTVDRFVEQVAGASDLLDDEKGDIRTSLDALDRAVRVVAAFAVDNREATVASLRSATRIVEAVMERRAALEEVLEVMPLALQNLQRVDDDGRLVVRMPTTALLPLGEELAEICQSLPLDLCAVIGGIDPNGKVAAP